MTKNLRTIDKFCEAHPAFTPGGIRWKIHKAHENGLADAGVIVRIGRRVYIDTERFDHWVTSQQSAA